MSFGDPAAISHAHFALGEALAAFDRQHFDQVEVEYCSPTSTSPSPTLGPKEELKEEISPTEELKELLGEMKDESDDDKMGLDDNLHDYIEPPSPVSPKSATSPKEEPKDDNDLDGYDQPPSPVTPNSDHDHAVLEPPPGARVHKRRVDLGEWLSLQSERAAADVLKVPWQNRGPPGPDQGGPQTWRGQQYRPNTGKWANRGGKWKDWYAQYYSMGKGKGKTAKGKYKGGKDKGKGKDNHGKGNDKGPTQLPFT